MLCAGPAAFLLALATIHEATTRSWDLVLTQRMVAIGLLLLLALLGRGLGPALLVGGVFAILAITVTLDVMRTGAKGSRPSTDPTRPSPPAI